MRVTRKMIERRVEILANRYPVPAGYCYRLESNNPGDGRRYNIAIQRTDYQGGDFYDIPHIGGYTGQDMYNILLGMLEVEWLKHRTETLPPVEDKS